MKSLLLSVVLGFSQPTTTVQPNQGVVVQQSVVRTTTTTTYTRHRVRRRGGCTNGTCR